MCDIMKEYNPNEKAFMTKTEFMKMCIRRDIEGKLLNRVVPIEKKK